MQVIDVLLKGPYTMKEISDLLKIDVTVTYRYIKTISEVLPVRSMKRKLHVNGRPPKVYWLE